MDDVWKLLITASSVLLAAITGNLIAAYVSRRNAIEAREVEHQQWLRNAKIEAYVDFLNAVSPFNLPRVEGRPDEEHFKAVFVAIVRVLLLGSKPVVEASQEAKVTIDKLFAKEVAPEVAMESIYRLTEIMKKDFQGRETEVKTGSSSTR